MAKPGHSADLAGQCQRPARWTGGNGRSRGARPAGGSRRPKPHDRACRHRPQQGDGRRRRPGRRSPRTIFAPWRPGSAWPTASASRTASTSSSTRAGLLYAGLDRVAASDVQLMRWTTDGKLGWIDATGAEAAEAMRMPVNGRISSGFGSASIRSSARMRIHKGVDVGAAFGTPIRASADGRISFAGWAGGYGRQVRIGHGEGLATSYSHMSRIAAASGAVRPPRRCHRLCRLVGPLDRPASPLRGLQERHVRSTRWSCALSAGSDLDKQERHNFNDRLRQLLTGRMG